MIAPRLILVLFSLVVLGAHFLRSVNLVAVAAIALLIVLVFVRRQWSSRTLQVALVLGTAEWLLTILNLTWSRLGSGQPYVRMVLILAAVAAAAVGSVVVLRSRTMRAWYRFPQTDHPAEAQTAEA